MSWETIYISKTGGNELDINGWSRFLSLIKPVNLDIGIKDDISKCSSVFGGFAYSGNSAMCAYLSTGFNSITGGFSVVDDTIPRYGVALDTYFPRETTEGEHYNCHFFLYSTDEYEYPVVRFKFGYDCTGGNIRRNTSSQKYYFNASIVQALTLEQLIDATWDYTPQPQQYEHIDYDIAVSTLIFCINVPLFLNQNDLETYISTGVKRNCLNDENTLSIGGDNNKYCQTTIQTMKPNGHDKATIYDYYYTYKMNSNQDIVGYVMDDENPLNVRFKAKNDEAYITITLVDGNHPFERVLTGSQFNNLDSEGNPRYETWYGCSTKREHTLMGGNICWGTFGRMNIYIFDTEAKANQYLQDGDPSKALNYDDIDSYNQRDTTKTGEDAGDQTKQNNALVTGWAEPSLSNVYILTSAKMEQVAELVFPDVTTQGELPQQIKDLKASLGLYGENPINDIIDVWHCPFNPYNFVERETRNIWFGSYRSEISTTHVTAHGKVVSLGVTVISPIYNDFRDYDIEITLYLPYFGTVELPADIYVGKKLEIKATLDLRSHNVRYYLFANDTLIEYHDCAVGTCYPLMGQDVAGKANQVMHAYNNLTTAKRNATITNGMGVLSSAYKLSSGDVMGAMNGLANVQTSYNDLQNAEKNLKQDIKYTQPARSIVGNSSPACSENDIPYPYIVFKIPQTIKPPLLQSTYGLPSNVITEIGNVSGYAQIENVQLASNLPKDIKADILAKLSSGVYIN